MTYERLTSESLRVMELSLREALALGSNYIADHILRALRRSGVNVADAESPSNGGSTPSRISFEWIEEREPFAELPSNPEWRSALTTLSQRPGQWAVLYEADDATEVYDLYAALRRGGIALPRGRWQFGTRLRADHALGRRLIGRFLSEDTRAVVLPSPLFGSEWSPWTAR